MAVRTPISTPAVARDVQARGDHCPATGSSARKTALAASRLDQMKALRWASAYKSASLSDQA